MFVGDACSHLYFFLKLDESKRGSHPSPRGVAFGVVFLSRAQKRVTLSSTDSEYVAMGDGRFLMGIIHLLSFSFPECDAECTHVCMICEDI